MNDLVTFYLLTSATYVFPILFIAVSLLQGTPLPFLSKFVKLLPPVQRAIRSMGISRLGQYFLLFNPDLTDYIKKFYVLASCLTLATMALIILAITYKVPFPFVSNIYGLLKPGVMSKLLKFGLISIAILAIPFFIFVLVLYFELPKVVMASTRSANQPSSLELGRCAKRSRKFAMVRVRRFETFEKIVFIVTCRSYQSGKILKLAFCEGKEDGGRTECYLYNQRHSRVCRITPVPITVGDLEQIFNIED